MKYLLVPGEWLNACGFGNVDRIFKVIDVFSYNDHRHLARVDRNGTPWTVYVELRGARFVDGPELNSASLPASLPASDRDADSSAVAVNDGGASLEDFAEPLLKATLAISTALSGGAPYVTRYCHDLGTPGELTLRAKNDVDAIDEVRAFVVSGFRNQTWAVVTLQDGREYRCINQHGLAKGRYTTS